MGSYASLAVAGEAGGGALPGGLPGTRERGTVPTGTGVGAHSRARVPIRTGVGADARARLPARAGVGDDARARLPAETGPGFEAAVPGGTHAGAVDLESAVVRARMWLEAVEAALSPFRAGSDLCRWRSGALDLEEASPLLREVVADIERVIVTTDGGFNPADGQGRYDPSGYVKGWSIRRAVEGLAADGVANVCLGVGGDVQMTGAVGPGQPWRTAVVDPAVGRRILAIIEQPVTGSPLAVATSGSAERGAHIWAGRGTRQEAGVVHLRGRRPRQYRDVAQLASVTVVGPDLGIADAYATAIWALAMDRPMSEAWQWLPATGYAALAVTTGGSILTTPGMGTYVVAPGG